MILITGANGLLGSFIANQLLHQKKEVIAFVRENADLALLNHDHKNLHLFRGDILDIVKIQQVFDTYPIKKVVHAAAVVSFQPKEYDMMYRVNIEGTKNIVNIALDYNVDKFLHVSSVAALGRTSNGIIDEKTSWMASNYNSKYGISKREAEIEVWRGQVEGLKTVIVNPSLVLAAADGKRSSSKFFAFIRNGSLFYPTGVLNYIDLRDASDIIIKLLNSNIENERFILTAGSISYKEFFTRAAHLNGQKAPSFPVKKITGILALFGDKIRSTIRNQKPMLSAESLRISRSKARFDNSKVKKELNFSFRPLDDTIEWVWQELNS